MQIVLSVEPSICGNMTDEQQWMKLLDMILRTISRDRKAVGISRLAAVNQLHYKNINKHQYDLFPRMCSICLLSTCGVRLLSTNQQLSRELPSLQDEPKNRKRESKCVHPPFPVNTVPLCLHLLQCNKWGIHFSDAFFSYDRHSKSNIIDPKLRREGMDYH